MVWWVILWTVIAAISVIMINVSLNEQNGNITIWNIVISCSFVSISNAITLTIYIFSLLQLRKTVKEFSHKAPEETAIFAYSALLFLNMITVIIACVIIIVEDTDGRI